MLPGYSTDVRPQSKKGIEEARKMSEDARRRLAEVEGRLSRLDTEIAGMRKEADENAKAERAAPAGCRRRRSAAGSWRPQSRKLRWRQCSAPAN